MFARSQCPRLVEVSMVLNTILGGNRVASVT
jgi:hypothetical protein